MNISYGKIYILVDPLTNQVRYVGQTISKFKERLRQHIYRSVKRNKSHKDSWILSLHNKGLKPLIEEVDCVNYNELDFWEKYYISLYKSWGFSILNLDDGGQKGQRMTQESKDKISLSLTGKKQSEETKLKRSLSNKIAWSDEILRQKQREKIQGKTNLERFGEIKAREISDKISLSKKTYIPSDETLSKISNTLKEKYKNETIINPNKIKIVQLSTDDKFIKIWNSISDAKKIYGKNINLVCMGKRNKCGGYRWLYLSDYEKNNI